MRLSTRLAAAIFAVAPVAGAADGQESKDENLRIVHGAAASEADDGTTVSLAPGMELAVALRAQPGSGCRWRVLQFDSAVLQGLGGPEVQFEPKPDGERGRLLLPRDLPVPGQARGRDGSCVRLFQALGKNAAGKAGADSVRTG